LDQTIRHHKAPTMFLALPQLPKTEFQKSTDFMEHEEMGRTLNDSSHVD
jgi:hypothetical protein